MDEKPDQNSHDKTKSDKYPESVLKFADFMRTATTIPSPSESTRNSINSITETVSTEGNEKLSRENNSPFVECFTPMSGYSRSPISCKKHSCGSLFAKCAEHNRIELLQTFTNRESQLSKKTFSYNRICRSDETVKYHQKRESLNSYFYGNDVSGRQQFQEKSLKISKDRVIGILSEKKTNGKKTKNRVTFAKSVSELNGLKAESNEITIPQKLDPCGTVTRHDSVPVSKSVLLRKSFGNLLVPFKKSMESEKTLKNYYLPEDKCMKSKFKRASLDDAKLIDSKFNLNQNNFNGERSLSCNNIDVLDVKCFDKGSTPHFIIRGKVNNFEKEDIGLKSKFCNNNIPIHDNFRNNQSKDENKVFKSTHRRGHDETSSLRSAMYRLKNESTELESEIDLLETEILLLRRELKKKDQDIVKLQQELHKLKSVLQDSSLFKHEDLLSSLHDSHSMPGQIQQIINVPNSSKKQGVSGESTNHGKNHDEIEIQRFEKDFRSKQIIKDALMENNFLKNLDMSQVREIVESVYLKEFSKGDYVVREGETGSHLYVSAEGEFEVIKDQKVLGKLGSGKAFGELAILYNCKRTASIKVVEDAKVWVLDRQVFQKIMMKTGLQRLKENLNFLRSVPLLKSLSSEVLAKVADVLEVDFYPSGEHIIRQGATGDTFYIISSGSVKVTQEKVGVEEEEEIRILKKGDYFGEQALLKEDWRTANVIALSPGVECLTLDRESFIQLIGDLSELQEKDYGDQIRGIVRPSSSSNLLYKQEYDYIRLQDLDVISTLGVGGFGRVELVQYKENRNMTFALKCLKKQHIVETKQQEHVYSEKNIMMSCNSQFICRLYRTFRDSKYVYMLQEALLGGEVWTILREKGCFDDNTTKFVTGCVIEAYEYLHTRGIIYRDLKPENLLLDSKGYIKLVDFGFSKRIGFSSKTWTFCGTPEYLAPEIILNKGHDRAVDYWSLGILMHELLTGIPPFTAPDPMKIYTFILKGIDMIDFPKHISKGAQSLIKRLCKDAPSDRLGYQKGGIQDIKKHKWFQGFDWEGLKQRILIPPLSPLVTSLTDTSNFDSYSKEITIPPDEFSNWDAEF